jgi:hypothetical protein
MVPLKPLTGAEDRLSDADKARECQVKNFKCPVGTFVARSSLETGPKRRNLAFCLKIYLKFIGTPNSD